MQNITISGNLTGDARVLQDQNGKEYMSFRVAVNDTRKGEKTSTFYDDEGNQVYTVDVYDEVLKNPAGALKEDQKKENSENGG